MDSIFLRSSGFTGFPVQVIRTLSSFIQRSIPTTAATVAQKRANHERSQISIFQEEQWNLSGQHGRLVLPALVQ